MAVNAEPGRLRRLLGRWHSPVRLCLLEDRPEEKGVRTLSGPFRLGFGAECDVRLDGERGPDVIFELEPTGGPLLVARAVPPEQFEDYVELTVDGEPVKGSLGQFGVESRLEILDKASQRRYRVTVQSAPNWLLQPRGLVLVIALLTVVGAGFGVYLHSTLRGAQSTLSRTAQRLKQAEAEVEQTEARLLEALGRVTASESSLAQAVDDLKALQQASEDRIRNDFTLRMEGIDARTQQRLSELATADTLGRQQLAEASREELTRLREEFSARMVESYQRMKSLEARLHETVSTRLASVEPPGEQLKRILAGARDAVLFIRTTYELDALLTGEVSQNASFGTGFLVKESGLAVTAQHVLYPWRHDNQYLVLNKLGLIEVVPDSVRWTVWTAGSRVLSDPERLDSIIEEGAFSSRGSGRGMRLVLVPDLQLSEIIVEAPMGLVQVSAPVPGSSDAAVIQLGDFDRTYPYLSIPDTAPAIDSLDEVLALGYPFSRLQDGIAHAQGARGFVRRVSENVLELDAPLHRGLSGGPILNRDGLVVGMAIAIISSDVYGLAMQHRDLSALLRRAEQRIALEKDRLRGLGCDPGPTNGTFDRRLWAAYECEQGREAEK